MHDLLLRNLETKKLSGFSGFKTGRQKISGFKTGSKTGRKIYPVLKPDPETGAKKFPVLKPDLKTGRKPGVKIFRF
jgi:hypothetical protein